MRRTSLRTSSQLQLTAEITMSEDRELYVHERYKFDDKEQELAEFIEQAKRVSAAQVALASQHSPGNPARVFHMKPHACLAGKLRLLEQRPEVTRQGIFAASDTTAYNVLARFSSGVGFAQAD